MTTKLTAKYTTICTVGYSGSVSRDENRAAHGGVKHCQAKLGRGGLVLGRYVNSNGRHEETGESFALDDETLAHWRSIAKASR